MSLEPLSLLLELLRARLRRWGPKGEPPEPVVQALAARAVRLDRGSEQLPLNGESGKCDWLDLLVIAFGLGWGRQLHFVVGQPLPEGWAGVWEKAVIWLNSVVFKAMLSASRFLEFGLGVQGYAFCDHPELNPGVAQQIAVDLITGHCPCSKLCVSPLAHGGTSGNYLRRLERCVRQHAVVGWDPRKASFVDFVYQAVKGIKPSHGGNCWAVALVQGMYYWYLHELCQLRLVDVLVWVCPTDGSLNFEGLPCLRCRDEQRGEVVIRSAFRTVVRRLVVPRHLNISGRYYEAAYWRCQNCCEALYPGQPFFPGTHYYPEELRECPQCKQGRGPGAKRSRVHLLARPESSLEERFVDLSTIDSECAPQEELLADGEGSPESEADPSAADEAAMLPHETPKKLWAAVGKLTPSKQRLIRLIYQERLTLEEAALRLGVSLAEAGRLHTAATRELKKALAATQCHPKGEEEHD
jgi:hypothetical protein